MRLIRPSAEILTGTINLHLIERAGRTCYKSEDKITPDSAEKFARMILQRGHESVIEHASATVRFVCDRGVSHEIVRHRLASYSQESTRYCDYAGGHITFVLPPWVNVPTGVYASQQKITFEPPSNGARVWVEAMLHAERTYQALRKGSEWKPERARSVLPNSLKTEIVMTANLREWRHFLKLRTAAAAHPQMREVALSLLRSFKGAVPVIFDDL